MTVKVIKNYKGGCQLLLVCPDETMAPPGPPTVDEPTPEPEPHEDPDPWFPHITLDLDIDKRKEIKRRGNTYEVPEPVPTDAPFDDPQYHYNDVEQVVPNVDPVVTPIEIVIPDLFPEPDPEPTTNDQPSPVPTAGLSSNTSPTLIASAVEQTVPIIEASTHYIEDVVPPKTTTFSSGGSVNRVNNVQTSRSVNRMAEDVFSKSSKALGKLATVTAAADILDRVSDVVDSVDDINDLVKAGKTVVDYVVDIIPTTKEAVKETAEAVERQDLISLGNITASLLGLPAIGNLLDKLVNKVTGVKTKSTDKSASASYGTSSISISSNTSGNDLLEHLVGAKNAASAQQLVDNADKVIGNTAKAIIVDRPQTPVQQIANVISKIWPW